MRVLRFEHRSRRRGDAWIGTELTQRERVIGLALP